MSVLKCNRLPGQTHKLFTLFETLDIEQYKKSVLQDRYLTVLRNFQYRANLYSFMFFTSRIVVTVGSILVPAFLSIQGNPIRDNLYLAAWIISILVTVCNGFVTLFKIDRKYYFIHMTLEMLHSEGWQYIGLTGRYAPKDSPIVPTHDNQFTVFCYIAEKIKLRQVEEEYWKFSDTTATGNTATHKPMDYIQTPITQQGPLASLPVDQKNVIEGWITEMSSKKAINGLSPRKDTILSLYESNRPTHIHHTHKNHTGHVDGEGHPKVRRTSSSTSVSVFPYVPEDSSPRAAMVPNTSPSPLFSPSSTKTFRAEEQIPENTTVTIMPNGADERV